MTDHPLKGYYLTRVYREGSDPFAVVSDLPKEKAIDLCELFVPHRRVGDGTGGQEAYLAGRYETEDWLRESAKAAGVSILKENPIYFTLTAESQEGMAPAGKKIISIPAENVDPGCCSFTYGDSMGTRTSLPGAPDYPFKGIVFNAQQVKAVVEAEGIKGDYIKGGRYFEVQMWALPKTEIAYNIGPWASSSQRHNKTSTVSRRLRGNKITV